MSTKPKIEDQWYTFYDSIIFIPPGEVPQVRGAWENSERVVEMLVHLTAEYPAETKFMVVSSRCGEIHVQSAQEWLDMRQVEIECAEEESAYIKAGVCSTCGACSAKDAETKCRPSALGDTGDVTCAGENLWREDEENNKADLRP